MNILTSSPTSMHHWIQTGNRTFEKQIILYQNMITTKPNFTATQQIIGQFDCSAAVVLYIYTQHNISFTTVPKVLFDPLLLRKHKPSPLVSDIGQRERENHKHYHLSMSQHLATM